MSPDTYYHGVRVFCTESRAQSPEVVWRSNIALIEVSIGFRLQLGLQSIVLESRVDKVFLVCEQELSSQEFL